MPLWGSNSTPSFLRLPMRTPRSIFLRVPLLRPLREHLSPRKPGEGRSHRCRHRPRPQPSNPESGRGLFPISLPPRTHRALLDRSQKMDRTFPQPTSPRWLRGQYLQSSLPSFQRKQRKNGLRRSRLSKLPCPKTTAPEVFHKDEALEKGGGRHPSRPEYLGGCQRVRWRGNDAGLLSVGERMREAKR